MEERVHPIPFRTWKLSSPSPMILHNVMWESRPLPTSFKKPFAATARRAFCCSVARSSFHLMQPDSLPFPISFIWAACAAGGRRGLLGAVPLRGPFCTPPGRPPEAFQSFTPARAARLLLRELPRCARRSPSAPRNASERFCLEWEFGKDISLIAGFRIHPA